MVTISRMQFLRGRVSGATPVVRPPWSHEENQFTTLCQRCDACISACPTHVLRRGQAGFPEVDFSQGECRFCGDCVTACPHSPFDRAAHQAGQRPWGIAAQMRSSCLTLNQVVCRSCSDACESSAISFHLFSGGIAKPQINHNRCTGCGACVAICPTRAISVQHHAEISATAAA